MFPFELSLFVALILVLICVFFLMFMVDDLIVLQVNGPPGYEYQQ